MFYAETDYENQPRFYMFFDVKKAPQILVSLFFIKALLKLYSTSAHIRQAY